MIGMMMDGVMLMTSAEEWEQIIWNTDKRRKQQESFYDAKEVSVGL